MQAYTRHLLMVALLTSCVDTPEPALETTQQAVGVGWTCTNHCENGYVFTGTGATRVEAEVSTMQCYGAVLFAECTQAPIEQQSLQ